jgi:hypothetical protein
MYNLSDLIKEESLKKINQEILRNFSISRPYGILAYKISQLEADKQHLNFVIKGN